jgi:hypothetical protein
MQRGRGGGFAGSQPMSTQRAQGAQINFGDVTPYLIYAGYLLAYPDEAAGIALAGPWSHVLIN